MTSLTVRDSNCEFLERRRGTDVRFSHRELPSARRFVKVRLAEYARWAKQHSRAAARSRASLIHRAKRFNEFMETIY